MRYRFMDGLYTFWCTELDPHHYRVFRVREDSTPEKRAAAKGLPFHKFWKAHLCEVSDWLDCHPEYRLIEAWHGARRQAA